MVQPLSSLLASSMCMTFIVVVGYLAHDVCCFDSCTSQDSSCIKVFADGGKLCLEPILAHIRFLAYYDKLHSYLVLVPQTATASTIYCTPNSIYCTIPRGSRT